MEKWNDGKLELRQAQLPFHFFIIPLFLGPYFSSTTITRL